MVPSARRSSTESNAPSRTARSGAAAGRAMLVEIGISSQNSIIVVLDNNSPRRRSASSISRQHSVERPGGARTRQLDGKTPGDSGAGLVLPVGRPSPPAKDDVPPASYPRLLRHALSVEAYIPQGWRLEMTKSGDLNGDGRPDAVLVVRDDDPDKFIDTGRDQKLDTNPRILVVALADAAGGYDLVLENHTLIARTNDPFQQDPLDPDGIQEGEVAIKNGTLRITLGYFGGNMGRMTYTFRFQNGRFEMIGYDRVDVTRNSGVMSDVSINYSTRQMVRKKGHISERQRESDAQQVAASSRC